MGPIKLPPKAASKAPSIAIMAGPTSDAETPDAEIPNEEATETQPTIRPDAVCFRHAEQKCSNCEYMGPDGMCAVLKITVTPDDGCNAFEFRES